MKVRILILTLLITFLEQLCVARLEVAFNLEVAAWEARDAVIVSQVGQQRFKVTEVWKGSLRVGDIVELRKVRDSRLAGSMILFLEDLRRAENASRQHGVVWTGLWKVA